MKERQEMGKKCESLRRVGVGAQRMEALLVRKRLLEECLGQWRREALHLAMRATAKLLR